MVASIVGHFKHTLILPPREFCRAVNFCPPMDPFPGPKLALNIAGPIFEGIKPLRTNSAPRLGAISDPIFTTFWRNLVITRLYVERNSPPLLVTVSTSPGAPCHFYKQFNLHINGFMEVKRGRVHPTHSERANFCYARFKSEKVHI